MSKHLTNLNLVLPSTETSLSELMLGIFEQENERYRYESKITQPVKQESHAVNTEELLISVEKIREAQRRDEIMSDGGGSGVSDTND